VIVLPAEVELNVTVEELAVNVPELSNFRRR